MKLISLNIILSSSLQVFCSSSGQKGCGKFWDKKGPSEKSKERYLLHSGAIFWKHATRKSIRVYVCLSLCFPSLCSSPAPPPLPTPTCPADSSLYLTLFSPLEHSGQMISSKWLLLFPVPRLFHACDVLLQDAHEFLCQCLDQLKEEMAKVNQSLTHEPKVCSPGGKSSQDSVSSTAKLVAPKEVGTSHIYTCPVADNMEFEVQHTITCKRWGLRVCETLICPAFKVLIPESMGTFIWTAPLNSINYLSHVWVVQKCVLPAYILFIWCYFLKCF